MQLDEMTSPRKWVLFATTMFGTVITWSFINSLTQDVLSPVILSGIPLETQTHKINGHTILTGRFISSLIVYLVLMAITVTIALTVKHLYARNR